MTEWKEYKLRENDDKRGKKRPKNSGQLTEIIMCNYVIGLFSMIENNQKGPKKGQKNSLELEMA